MNCHSVDWYVGINAKVTPRETPLCEMSNVNNKNSYCFLYTPKRQFIATSLGFLWLMKFELVRTNFSVRQNNFINTQPKSVWLNLHGLLIILALLLKASVFVCVFLWLSKREKHEKCFWLNFLKRAHTSDWLHEDHKVHLLLFVHMIYWGDDKC